jgi:hypothetical protein
LEAVDNIDYLVIAGLASRDPYEIVRVETILFGPVGDSIAFALND